MLQIKLYNYFLLIVALFIGCFTRLSAQDPLLSLQQCIAYAKVHNLTLAQSELNERVTKMQWEQRRWAQLPNISVSSSYGRNFGRSIDPTTNAFQNTTYDFTGLNGSTNVLLFGWFKQRNEIAKSDLQQRIALANTSQAENDISLNITTAFLRILLAKEQIKIAEHQLSVTNKQVLQTQSLLNSGRSNGQDMAQVKTQLANDSTQYFRTVLAEEQAIIDLKAILNFEFEKEIEIVPYKESLVHLDLLSLDAEIIFDVSKANFGSIKAAAMETEVAKRDLRIARSGFYPQMNFSASSGTNYSSSYVEFLPDGTRRTMQWGKQFQNNFSQSVYLGVSIPLFNGFSTRYAVKQSKIAIQNSVLKEEESRLKLKQEIYKACNDVQTAIQTYRSAQNASSLALTGMDFAQKRYDKGLIAAIDLLLVQNTYFKASIDEISARYDLMFKRLIIDYYLNEGIFKN